MPNITYNGQSFSIDGRRMWVLGASIQYARVPASLWAARIAAARQAGFNTIETGCPWAVHEPRKGRLVFDGDANLRQFVQLCGAAGMRVILRAGPYIGGQFDGGGLPGWLIETPGIKLREHNAAFLEHVSRYFRRLLGEVSDLQITGGGPIILVQSEHAWTCSNEHEAATYLNEITRFIRESGITVPIINANDLWQDTPGTIDTWRGYNDLLAHLRQLRTVQPTAPRLVSEFAAADVEIWGGERSGRSNPKSKVPPSKSADAVLRHLAEILAGGAQPIVTPFHAGTNFGFLGGRVSSCGDGFVTTEGAVDPPLGQAGTRGRKYHAIRRLITFANHFGPVFAELEPDYQPIVLDPAAERASSMSVVPLRGPQGRIVFVFSAAEHRPAKSDGVDSPLTLVLDDGIRLPVHLGDQSVGWYALDVDLQGVGRLDYSNICPWAMIDRSIVVFQGPAGAAVILSIGGTPLEATVPPEDHKHPPLVLEHKGLTIVICNQSQIDSAYHDDKALYVGIAGFDAAGQPKPDERQSKAYVIRKNARVSPLDAAVAGKAKASNHPPAKPHSIALSNWHVADTNAFVTGQSPRFASLEGPETLSECGAPVGYGWYRVTLKGTGRRLCHAPQAADRLHLFVDGARAHLFGVGPGADAEPFELRLAREGGGDHTLVALVDNLGRFSDGNEIGQCKGLWGHIYEVKALRSVKPKLVNAKPVSPFALRGFISGLDAAQLSDTAQAVWTFTHTRKTSIIVDVSGAHATGTFVLNDKPIAYYPGASGGCLARILLDAKTESFKRGKNVLRFAPDMHQHEAADDVARKTVIYECVDDLTAGGWAFAKWEPPAVSTYDEFDKSQARSFKGQPCWWRAKVEIPPSEHADSMPYWLDVAEMSKGQAYVNGQNLGRYFTATGQGKAVGPQTRLYVPTPWIKIGQLNEIVIFDEHGFDPSRVRLIHGPENT